MKSVYTLAPSSRHSPIKSALTSYPAPALNSCKWQALSLAYPHSQPLRPGEEGTNTYDRWVMRVHTKAGNSEVFGKVVMVKAKPARTIVKPLPVVFGKVVMVVSASSNRGLTPTPTSPEQVGRPHLQLVG